ncbi:MAG: hypothetical protein AB8F94_08900 [Saprospiraceae bacterium]
MTSKIYLYAFCTIIFSTLFITCKNDDDNNNMGGDQIPDFYVEGELFSCPSNLVDLSSVDFQINHAYEYEGFIIGGGFSDLVIANAEGGDIVEIDTVGVSQFLEYDGKLMMCSFQGLYSLDPQKNITLEADERCHSILISADGTFLMGASDNRILSWNSTQGVTPYTDAHQSNHLDLYNLIELKNGELWGTINGKVARFKDQLFLEFFDTSNIPLNDFFFDSSIFLKAYDEGAILAAKIGQTYQILKYTNAQEWVVLFDSASAPSSDETITITQPSLTDILIHEDKLYVSTTIASCKGFQVFDITKNELLAPEDYFPQYDSNFDHHCIHGLSYGASGDIFTIARNQILKYDCN